MQKVCDVRRNDWNKVSQNITEEFHENYSDLLKKTTRFFCGNA